MRVDGTLQRSATGRAELQHNGDIFSFPGRLVGHRVRIVVPEGSGRDVLTTEGVGPRGVRVQLRLQNGRAEYALPSGEVVSFPARLAGRLVAIDVFDKPQDAAAPGSQPRASTVQAPQTVVQASSSTAPRATATTGSSTTRPLSAATGNGVPRTLLDEFRRRAASATPATAANAGANASIAQRSDRSLLSQPFDPDDFDAL